MTKRNIGALFGTALLIAAAVVALRERQTALPPEVSVAQTSSEVRVNAVERNPAALAAQTDFLI